jgi:hypothetical protein
MAVQNAKASDKPVHFMGGVINEHTLAGLSHEKRMHFLPQLWRLLRTRKAYHATEYSDMELMMNVRGIDQMSENLDDKHMGTLVYDFKMKNPYQKKIMVDNENERLFNHIYNSMEGRSL